MRINLWAAAGVGKSTVASGLYYHLKKDGYNVELVSEYIKKWAYEKKVPKSFDQLYVFAKQLHTEDSFLNHGVEHLVTDSPIGLQLYYTWKYNFISHANLVNVAKDFETKYPSFNILLDREGIEYKARGRYETEEQAKHNDLELCGFMNNLLSGNYITCKSIDLDLIVEKVKEQLCT